MKKQTGFTLIEILIVLAVSIIVAAGGKVIWEKNITISPTPTSPVPTSVNCQTDADCPQVKPSLFRELPSP